MEVPADEIDLSQISNENSKDLFKIIGKYKNPKFESWSNVEPGKEVTFLWPWHFGFGACILFYLKKANLMKKPVYFYTEPLALLPYR